MKPDTNTMSTDHNSDVLKIFGIDSNIIEHYDIFHRKDGVHIILKLINREQRCPVCQTRTTKVVNYIDKKIKHSVVSTSPCFIDYHARRYRCPACNKTFYESNPFTFGTERISSATVYSVLQDLKKPFETFKSVGERYHISTNTVINIFDRYISTPRLPMPSVLSIDEVYVPTDDRNKYLCILFDFETKMIIDVLPSRHKNVLSAYFHSVPLDERKNVEYMSSDMWVSYHDISKIFLPDTIRTIDRFHLLMEFSKKFNSIRCETMKKYALTKNAYQKEKTKRKLKPDEEAIYREACINYYAFKKFSWLFYKTDSDILNPNNDKKFNRVFNRYMNFYDIHEHICSCDNGFEEICNLKYDLDMFFKNSTVETAKENLENLIKDFKENDRDEMKNFAGTLSRWKNEIIHSFTIIGESTINNGRIEHINRTIKTIKRNANGYKNFERLRRRIMWCVNKQGNIILSQRKENES